MKVQELFEASTDFTANVAELEQTPEFKIFSKKFNLVSTRIQRKNGSLQFETKDEVLKHKRLYFANSAGKIKVQNDGAGMWANIGRTIQGGPIGSTGRMISIIKLIETHFDEWFAKRLRTGSKSGKDVSNLNLKTLTELNLPTKAKDFNCSHNHLTSLEGAPLVDITSDFNCSHNELTSPLTNVPKECRLFSANHNKLTTFEGFPEKCGWIHLHENNFTSYKGIEKHIKECGGFSIDFTCNGKPIGLLSFFKVTGCKQLDISSKWEHTQESEEMKEVQSIINRHLKEGRNVVACQEELFQNGFDGYARL